MSLIAVYTTVAHQSDAQIIANAVVEQRLAACVHIMAIESVYSWAGALQHDTEWRIICKTLAQHYTALAAAIRQLHPYTLPAIYALPLVECEPDYAAWVQANVAEV